MELEAQCEFRNQKKKQSAPSKDAEYAFEEEIGRLSSIFKPSDNTRLAISPHTLKTATDIAEAISVRLRDDIVPATRNSRFGYEMNSFP